MGEGWHLDFKRTHFDLYSPPDFYVKVLAMHVFLVTVCLVEFVLNITNWQKNCLGCLAVYYFFVLEGPTYLFIRYRRVLLGREIEVNDCFVTRRYNYRN